MRSTVEEKAKKLTILKHLQGFILNGDSLIYTRNEAFRILNLNNLPDNVRSQLWLDDHFIHPAKLNTITPAELATIVGVIITSDKSAIPGA